MLNEKNAYFEELIKTAREWSAAKEERNARKQEIINKYGYDSPELEAWHAENEAVKHPISGGASKAMYAWSNSVTHKEDELDMADFLWKDEVADFLDAIQQAGFTSFVLTNTSTAVMENIHWFVAAGWEMEGTCMISKTESVWHDDVLMEVMGIRFKLFALDK